MQRGFGLLEALVALAIAALSFSALYAAVGQSAQSASGIDERMEAALVARSVLASAVFAEDFARTPSGSSGHWNWSAQVVSDQLAITDRSRGMALTPLRGARVELMVADARKSGSAPYTWTAWKPLRESAP